METIDGKLPSATMDLDDITPEHTLMKVGKRTMNIAATPDSLIERTANKVIYLAKQSTTPENLSPGYKAVKSNILSS